MESKVYVPRRKSLASLEYALSIEHIQFLWTLTLFFRGAQRQFSKNNCSEDDLHDI